MRSKFTRKETLRRENHATNVECPIRTLTQPPECNKQVFWRALQGFLSPGLYSGRFPPSLLLQAVKMGQLATKVTKLFSPTSISSVTGVIVTEEMLEARKKRRNVVTEILTSEE